MIRGIVALLFALSASGGRVCQAEKVCNDCILIYGDSRSGHDIHRHLVAAMLKLSPETVFHTGDLVSNGYDADEWKIFNQITGELRAKSRFFPVLGNHEREAPRYFENFGFKTEQRWYSVDRHGIHFVVLDTNVDYSTVSTQYRWLENDLAEVSQSAPFIILLCHQPVYDTGPHAKESGRLRRDIAPLLEKYRVNVVFAGHDHDYERSFANGIFYVVTGGGGAPLYRQKLKSPYSQKFISAYHFCALSLVRGRLLVTIYDAAMKELDRFEISPREIKTG